MNSAAIVVANVYAWVVCLAHVAIILTLLIPRTPRS
jgi:hypothetical protein